MPLLLKPNCEYCDKDLPPHSEDACICSYECTFCRHCVETRLENVCPNCGGGFERRPVRPALEWRKGVSLSSQPASDKRVRLSQTPAEIERFVERVKQTLPQAR